MLRALVLGAVLLVPAAALPAQAPRPPVQIVMDEDGVIEGRGDGPDGSEVSTPGRAQHSSTIRLRTNFADKVLQSVSEL